MKLKTCLFCNSAEVKMRTADFAYQVICPKCGMRGPIFSNPNHGSDWTAQAWNNLERTSLTKCPACLRMIEPIELVFNTSIGYVPACPLCESPLE